VILLDYASRGAAIKVLGIVVITFLPYFNYPVSTLAAFDDHRLWNFQHTDVTLKDVVLKA